LRQPKAGSIGSTVSVVWKEETVLFVRDRVRVERTALGIVGDLDIENPLGGGTLANWYRTVA
jgi:hypothetical protein